MIFPSSFAALEAGGLSFPGVKWIFPTAKTSAIAALQAGASIRAVSDTSNAPRYPIISPHTTPYATKCAYVELKSERV